MDAKLLKILEECNKNIIDAETAREQIINLFSADCKGFSTGKVGDYLRCEAVYGRCLLYTSPSPRDQRGSRMPSSA